LLHDVIEPYAKSVELTHCASLIHDDVIDLEVERRGQVALQNHIGNKQAILIGNIIFLKTFEAIKKIEDKAFFEVFNAVAIDMCVGEIIQSETLEKGMSELEYESVIFKKTGRLISASIYLAAKLADVDEKNLKQVQILGDSLGILYQLRDDLKDNDANILDKNTVSRLKEKHDKRVNEAIDALKSTYDNIIKFQKIVKYFK
jgi:octaprenyl-diphosphate synthase